MGRIVADLSIEQHERIKRQRRAASARWRKAHPNAQRERYAALTTEQKRERFRKQDRQRCEKAARFRDKIAEEGSQVHRNHGLSVITTATLKRPSYIVQMPGKRPWLETLDTNESADEDEGTGDD